ncbi:hypothetical protein BGW80DRAFT_1248404 [Lactifluus volemus]|nr:hypothetical protein BGW80DRAFT_1248404 [Lactifluus volemus]
MATVTHYIRSNYDPEKDKDQLLKETGQIDEKWHQESSLAGFSKSNRLTRPVNFVPATQPALFTSHHSNSDDVATWYSSLNRQSNSDPVNALPSSHQPRLVAAPKQRPHWFISRAISQSTSEPTPTPLTSSNDSLADILSRKPPTTNRPFKPPVFLHLGPSNKGWTMLQNQGWSEGEALGPNSKRKTDDAHVRAGTSMRKNERKKNKKKEGGGGSSNGIKEQEWEDDPDVTMTPDSDSAAQDPPNPTTSHQTALLTPLPTVLKSDRLGIGLKAKTEGPYRSSVKRVTHNAAALAAHVKASEDTRRAQRRFGKGRRSFARIERLERESRQNVMAYLSEPF